MKNIVIVDIDGTVSKVGDRLRFLQQNPVDWDSFYESCFEDEPIKEICELVKDLNRSCYEIYFCTGRRESVRPITVDWIIKNIEPLWTAEWVNKRLLMRPDGDKRHDTIVKPEQLKEAEVELNNIAFVLEDRNSMVAEWREMGLRCLQVAEGDF